MAAELEAKLARMLRAPRVHPTWLLQGQPDDTQKLAHALSRLVFCTAKGPKSCGQCSGCRQVDKRIHPDLVWLDTPDDEVLKAESVRTLIHQMELSPVANDVRLAIVPQAHRMTPAAANSLLKVLEEPLPRKLYWLLTPQRGGLPTTLLSRCLVFRLPNGAPVEVPGARERETALRGAITSGLLKPIWERCDEKAEAQLVISLLQAKVRAWTLGEIPDVFGWVPPSPFEASVLFGQLVELEGLLRGNANLSLAMENFFLQNPFRAPRPPRSHVV